MKLRSRYSFLLCASATRGAGFSNKTQFLHWEFVLNFKPLSLHGQLEEPEQVCYFF